MTLDEARKHIGDDVEYRRCCNPHAGQGVITSVRGQWVFVCYGWATFSEATSPADLTLLARVRELAP